jgi:branched-subunit amino acid transport protein AzlD
MSLSHSVLIVVVAAVCTYLLRAAAFVLFRGKKQLPKSIGYLGSVLPPAIIAILVVYCLKSIDLTAAPHGLPELLAVCAVAALHVWKRSNLLSIGAGTVFYMFLVQVVFS